MILRNQDQLPMEGLSVDDPVSHRIFGGSGSDPSLEVQGTEVFDGAQVC